MLASFRKEASRRHLKKLTGLRFLSPVVPVLPVVPALDRSLVRRLQCWVAMPALLRRFVASLALVAFVGTLALPLASQTHLAWNDDPDCGPAAFGPHHTTTALRAAGDPLPTGHCALCHWLRAFAGASLTPVQSSTPALDARNVRAARLTWWHGRLAAIDRPSRAPPSATSL